MNFDQLMTLLQGMAERGATGRMVHCALKHAGGDDLNWPLLDFMASAGATAGMLVAVLHLMLTPTAAVAAADCKSQPETQPAPIAAAMTEAEERRARNAARMRAQRARVRALGDARVHALSLSFCSDFIIKNNSQEEREREQDALPCARASTPAALAPHACKPVHVDAPQVPTCALSTQITQVQEAGGMLLPPDWAPKERHFALAAKLEADADTVRAIADEMTDYVRGDERIIRKRNWDSYFANWLRRVLRERDQLKLRLIRRNVGDDKPKVRDLIAAEQAELARRTALRADLARDQQARRVA